MDESSQPQEGTNPEPEVAAEVPTPEEPEEAPEDPEVEETVPKSQFRQALARAKKAEEENKKLKAATQPQQQVKQINNQNVPDELIEEKILKAQGVSDEMLKQMKALAKVRGVSSLIDVQKDPIILALQKEKEEEDKAKKAKLGASKGSGQVKKEETFSTPGLSPQKHKQMWKEKMGR